MDKKTEKILNLLESAKIIGIVRVNEILYIQYLNKDGYFELLTLNSVQKRSRFEKQLTKKGYYIYTNKEYDLIGQYLLKKDAFIVNCEKIEEFRTLGLIHPDIMKENRELWGDGGSLDNGELSLNI